MSDEAAQRAAVVAEAMTWLGTPYHPRARVKGAGVDCAMLPSQIYFACGLIPLVDPEYSEQWHLHRDEELYLSFVKPHAREITREQIGPGDFAIWKIGRVYSHGAIITALPSTIVHATLAANMVTLDDMDRDELLRTHPVRFWSLWGPRA